MEKPPAGEVARLGAKVRALRRRENLNQVQLAEIPRRSASCAWFKFSRRLNARTFAPSRATSPAGGFCSIAASKLIDRPDNFTACKLLPFTTVATGGIVFPRDLTQFTRVFQALMPRRGGRQCRLRWRIWRLGEMEW